MTTEQRTIDVQDARVEGRTLHGFAALYGEQSRDLGRFTETIQAGAFTDVLAGSPDVYLTFNHSPDKILARTTSGTLRLRDEERGLAFEADLGDGPTAMDVRDMVKRGDVRGASFRFTVADGGERWDGEQRTLTKIGSLIDLSLATVPAYDGPRVEIRSAPQPEQEAPVPAEETQEGGGLRLESRSAAEENPTIESRIVDAMAGVPKGESRTLSLATAGPVEPTDLSTFLFDQLRPSSVVLASGVRVVETQRHEWKAPTLIGDVLADFYGESDPIQETDPDFDEFSITPRAIKALVRGSSEAFDDSNPDLLTIITQNLATVLALRFDYESLVGDSESGFKGLSLIEGRQTLAGGSLEDYDWYTRAAGMLQEAHVPPPYAVIYHPRVDTQLGLIKEFTSGESNVSLPRPAGMPTPFVTSQLPIDVSTPSTPTTSVLVFAPEQIVCARRMDVTIEVDRSNSFDTDEVLVRAKLRASIGTCHPEAIVEITDVVSPVINGA